METTTNTSTNNHKLIIEAIILQTEDNQIELNIDMVLQVIDKIESVTGCKLYNQKQLTTYLVELDKKDFSIKAKKAIRTNLIPQIDFSILFKSELGFTLVFNQDDIVILYKNKKIIQSDLKQIKSDLTINISNDIPPISILYLDNIIQVIEKFINKDISVQYYCSNIPQHYLKLFEIKCKKANTITTDIKLKCEELEKVITGKIFKLNETNIKVDKYSNDEDDDELKNILIQIEEYENKNKNKYVTDIIKMTKNEKKALDDVYRMEVMSYLDDTEIIIFLNMLEKADEYDKNIDFNNKPHIVIYLNFLLEAINNINNKIAKIYYIYKIYILINSEESIIESNDQLRTIVIDKIIELEENMYILQSADLKLYYGVIHTIEKSKKLIDSIEIKKNPKYVSSWNNNYP
jgi:hypothetical protein